MVIPLNRVYCKHSIYHKTSYNKSGGVKVCVYIIADFVKI